MVTNTGEVPNTAAADEHDAVLLKIVTDAGNVGRNLDSVGKAHTGNFTECRVRLLGGSGLNCGANAALLGGIRVGHDLTLGIEALKKRRGLGLFVNGLSTLTDELIKSWHIISPFFKNSCFFGENEAKHIATKTHHTTNTEFIIKLGICQ